MPIIKLDQLPWARSPTNSSEPITGSASRSSSSTQSQGAAPRCTGIPTRKCSSCKRERQTSRSTESGTRQARATSSSSPNQAHSFVNSGNGPLRQIDIHLSPNFSTEWLEDRDQERDDA